MPPPPNLKRAELRAIRWVNERATDPPERKVVTVQFNPETMRVNYANQRTGGDQRGGSSMQFTGRGTTKLSLELWFDATVPWRDGINTQGDVRKATQEIVFFITPNEDYNDSPPGVRFVWGSFKFDGVMESIDESLEYFSEEGKPLRAKVSISIQQQAIQFLFEPTEGSSGQGAAAPAGGAPPGTRPRQAARQGDSVQRAAARSGQQQNWRQVAGANNIENPRRLPAGTLLDVNPPTNTR